MNEAPRIKEKRRAVGPVRGGQRVVLLSMTTRGTPSNMGHRFRQYAWEVAGEFGYPRYICERLPSVISTDGELTKWEGVYTLKH